MQQSNLWKSFLFWRAGGWDPIIVLFGRIFNLNFEFTNTGSRNKQHGTWPAVNNVRLELEDVLIYCLYLSFNCSWGKWGIDRIIQKLFKCFEYYCTYFDNFIDCYGFTSVRTYLEDSLKYWFLLNQRKLTSKRCMQWLQSRLWTPISWLIWRWRICQILFCPQHFT